MTTVIKATKDGYVRMLRTEDGRFEIWAGEERISHTVIRAVAEDEYAIARREHNSEGRTKAALERRHFDMQAMRSESFERRTANAQKPGGPGGRGGV